MKSIANTRIGKSFVAFALVFIMIFSPLAPTQRVDAFWDYVVDIISIGVSAYQCFDGEGNTWVDCGLFGLDVGLAILPFVPSGLNAAKTASSGVKVGTTVLTKGDDVIDAIRGFDKVYDAIDAGYPILNSIDDLNDGKTIIAKVGTLRKIGDGVIDLERHHLVPEALAAALGKNGDDLAGVLITKSFHRGADNIITTPLNNLVASLKVNGVVNLANGDNMVKLLNGLSKVYKGNKVLQATAIVDVLKSPAGIRWLTHSIGLTTTGVAKVFNVIDRGSITNADLEDGFRVSVEQIEAEINKFENLPSPYKRINLTGGYKEVDDVLNGLGKSPDKFSYGGHTYQVVNPPNGTTWSAQDVAKASGGYLAQINSKDEQFLITNLLKASAQKNVYWLGGWYNANTSKWMWQRVTGSNAFGNGVGDPISYSNWKEKEEDREYAVDQNQGFIGVLGKSYSGNTSGQIGQWISENYNGNQQGNEWFQSKNFGYIIEWDYITADSVPFSSSSQPKRPSTGQLPSQSTHDVNTWYYYNRSGFDKGQYKGDWIGAVPHGHGTLKYDSDNKYSISYSDGRIYHASEYVGSWADGRKYGQGIFTFDDGTQYNGIWNKDGYYFKGDIISNVWKRSIEQIIDPNDPNRIRIITTNQSEWVRNDLSQQPNTETDSSAPSQQKVGELAVSVCNDPDSSCAIVQWSQVEGASTYKIYRMRLSTGVVSTFTYGNYLSKFIDAEAFYDDSGKLNPELGYGGFRYRVEAYNSNNALITQSQWIDYNNSKETAEIYLTTTSDEVILTWSVNGYAGFNLVAYEEVSPGSGTHTWSKTPVLADGKSEIRFSKSDFTQGQSYRFYIGAFSPGLVCVSNYATYTPEKQSEDQSFTFIPTDWILQDDSTNVWNGASERPLVQSIYLYIGFSEMDTNNGRVPIDNSGTSPVIKNGRTLLPIRAIIESMGGTVEWDGTSDPHWDKVTCTIDSYHVQMWIGYGKYYVNGREYVFDVPPEIINNRTMIPARALFEAIGCTVDWEKNGGGEGWDMVTITFQQ
jgi:hypothetical protein